MGILERSDSKHPTPLATKRKAVMTDFSKLGPLNNKSFGTKGFTGYRETTASKKTTRKGDEDAMDSDADDDDLPATNDNDEIEVTDSNGKLLSPEDAKKQRELAEGVERIKVKDSYRSLYHAYLSSCKQLKRAHSAEPLGDARTSPHMKTSTPCRCPGPTSSAQF